MSEVLFKDIGQVLILKSVVIMFLWPLALQEDILDGSYVLYVAERG